MQNHIANLATLSEAAQNIALPGSVKCTTSSTETQALTAALTQAGRIAPTVTKVISQELFYYNGECTKQSGIQVAIVWHSFNIVVAIVPLYKTS
jgi:hypothetical protein